MYLIISLPSILIPTAIAAGIALVLGIVLVVAARFFALPVDEKLEKVRSALPGVNCGGVGITGSSAVRERTGFPSGPAASSRPRWMAWVGHTSRHLLQWVHRNWSITAKGPSMVIAPEGQTL